MGSKVLVTGAADRVAAASAALREAGAEVAAVDDPATLATVLAAIPPRSLDCYVQLPMKVAPRGPAVVERVHNFLEDGLLTRFTAAATILPMMSDGARIVLVGGNTPGEAATPDNQGARLALLDVLARAIQADLSATTTTVLVLPHDEEAAHIAAVALGGPTRDPAPAELRTGEPELSPEEWRIEVMGQAHWEF